MERISVIIPMYNAEPYIRRCLQSLFDQTYQNWEAIVVTDGSTDRSLDICQELAAGDRRIHIISQENSGVSAARNRGLDAAVGAYIFFLDSDDAIHPLLLEEMILQATRSNADLLACGQAKLEPDQLDPILRAVSVHEHRPDWKIPSPDISTKLCISEAQIMSGTGGKMIRHAFVRKLRFREDLFLGEDTYFIHQLLRQSIQVAYTTRQWYYYIRHPTSLTRSLVADPRYYDVYRLLQEYDLAAGCDCDAATWEKMLLKRLQANYLLLRQQKDTAGMAALQKIAEAERQRPSFRSQPRHVRKPFEWCFFNYPRYRIYLVARKICSTASQSPAHRVLTGLKHLVYRFCPYISYKIGILTFYCSDNFGAMLQAYGLRTYLRRVSRLEAAIVPYSPPYMTGRHWYIPYVPFTGNNAHIRCWKNALAGWKRHQDMGRDFSRQRANMRRFRRKYLAWNHIPILFTWQLYFQAYQCYVVGSDQIWNPDITLGLRRAYFGAFPGLRKKRVVAYAASLGREALPDQYDQQFASLLSHVDAVSVREAEAIPYLQKFRSDPVPAVLDPVFLLGREEWQQVECLPDRKSFILLYLTEQNPALYAYARQLSQEKDLPVVELKASKWRKDEFITDYTAGPSEFLGYIHQADYVVTNSFHAVAFSIIYQKQFMVFLHSTLGARVLDVLRLHGLENHIYREGADIDAPTDWDAVLARSQENARLSEKFIREQIY